jgi:type VI secretion system protein VasG
MPKANLNALLERLHPFCLDRLQTTAALCGQLTHPEVGVEHFLKQLNEPEDADFGHILRHFGLDQAFLARALDQALDEHPKGHAGRPAMSTELVELLQDAWLAASLELGEASIRSGCALLAILAQASAPGEPQGAAKSYLNYLGHINRDELVDRFRDIVRLSSEEAQRLPAPWRENRASRSDSGAGESALSLYCFNLSESAASGAMDPVFGRDREMRQLIDILARRRKNNPIIVGDAGVGKTALVEGLAQRIAAGDAPELLKGVTILGLDIGLLEAGAGVKGEFENRLKSVIREIKDAPTPIILFIDEAHTLIGAGGRTGGSDAANLLKPALARGELRTIAATTWPEYKKYFEKDQALTRRFQPVKIEEPSVEATVDILRGLKPRYERDHGVAISDQGILAAAEFSDRYISGRLLPDKAVDLLDTSAARVKVSLTHKPPILEENEKRVLAVKRKIEALHRDRRNGLLIEENALNRSWEQLEELKAEAEELKARWERERALVTEILGLRLQAPNGGGGPTGPQDRREHLSARLAELKALQSKGPLIRHEVDPDVVAKVISDWTGIPLGKVMRDQALSVLQLKDNLGVRIRGQEQALDIISRAVKAAKSGLKDPRLPMGVFLLVGPSGVGKTETAMALADQLFGDERAIISVNMSEFQERHSLSRLIGAPPGYAGYGEGGVLTEAIRRRPYSVVLLDEAEKAHLEVLNLFYQVFDKGSMADGEGRVVDFRHSIVFLTSNLAADRIARLFKERRSNDPLPVQTALGAIRPVLVEHFKPALLGRMTIVPYFPLSNEALREIVGLKLDSLATRLLETNHMRLSYPYRLLDNIASRCADPETGARAIDAVFGQTILPRMSEEILNRMFQGSMPTAAHLDVNEAGKYVVAFE